jgi:hypothetical protein
MLEVSFVTSVEAKIFRLIQPTTKAVPKKYVHHNSFQYIKQLKPFDKFVG